jgi:hypothetical protein
MPEPDPPRWVTYGTRRAGKSVILTITMRGQEPIDVCRLDHPNATDDLVDQLNKHLDMQHDLRREASKSGRELKALVEVCTSLDALLVEVEARGGKVAKELSEATALKNFREVVALAKQSVQ